MFVRCKRCPTTSLSANFKVRRSRILRYLVSSVLTVCETMTNTFEEAKLQNVLETIARNEGFKQPRFSIVSATKPGDNFISRVFRVQITEASRSEDKKSLQLIFKASSLSRARQEMLSSETLFKTESNIYNIVLPELNNFLKKHGIADHRIFPGTPRCLSVALNEGSENGETEVIVLEDLKVHGYSMVDFKAGIDEHLCRLALEKLALLHASSLALQELEPEKADRIFKLIDGSLWDDENDPAFLDIKEGFLVGLGMLGEPYKEGNPVYDKLYNIYQNFYKDQLELWEKPEKLACLIHGDFWSNNILFKFKDEKPEDACMIDFQISCINSPVKDISNLLLICTTKEMRDQHYANLIRFYYDKMCEILGAFGCDAEKIFPWNIFQEQMRFHGREGLVSSLMSIPILMADISEITVDIQASEANTLFTNSVKLTKPETLALVTKRLNDVVSDCVQLGYI